MPVHRHPVAPLPDAIPLDHALIARLRAGFERLRPHADRFALAFYTRLFGVAPHLRPLFSTDQRLQAAKLVASLEAIVDNLGAPTQNADMLAQLGRRHAAYGARPEHYPLVVDLLIQSMRDALGHDADPALLDEWRTALELVSRHMIAAGAPHSA